MAEKATDAACKSKQAASGTFWSSAWNTCWTSNSPIGERKQISVSSACKVRPYIILQHAFHVYCQHTSQTHENTESLKVRKRHSIKLLHCTSLSLQPLGNSRVTTPTNTMDSTPVVCCSLSIPPADTGGTIHETLAHCTALIAGWVGL